MCGIRIQRRSNQIPHTSNSKRVCVLLVVKKLICVRLFCTAADTNMPDNFSIGYITSSSRGAYNLFRKQNN